MRLDQYLRASRLVVRRTLAQELCDAGGVLVNGRAAKSARAVSVGDEVEVRTRRRLMRVRVAALPAGGGKQTARGEAANLYEVLADTIVAE